MAIEPLPFPSRKERRKALGEASYNVFHLRSRMITIDLVSDSGTGTMSVKQWRNLLMADEAFSFQKSYDDFVAKAKELTGFEFILPVHQARAAEHILFKLIIRKGTRVIANHLFATTREHLIRCGAEIFELPREGSGDINLKLLKKRLKKDSVVILSVTSNHHGGQVVALDNIEMVSSIVKGRGLLIIDGCRFAENSYLESKRLKIDIKEAIRRTFAASDIFYLSTKKDLLTNIGGMVGVRDKRLFIRLNEMVLAHEGYPSHGGLAGRDLAAITQSFNEIIDLNYLSFRIEQVQRLGRSLKTDGVPVHEPFGCHAITIPACDFVPGLPHPGFTGAAKIYLDGGIRGGVFFEDGEVIRLAIPRRVYTNSQIDYVARSIISTYRKGRFFKLRPTYKPDRLSNFLLRFQRG